MAAGPNHLLEQTLGPFQVFRLSSAPSICYSASGNLNAAGPRLLSDGPLGARKMTVLSQYELKVYTEDDLLPAEADEIFARQLVDSRKLLPPHHPDRDQWHFVLICAVTPAGHVLGGVHLDIGPIGGAGPIAKKSLAYLERTLVRPEYRRQGLATILLRRAVQEASAAGCEYIRCSNNWDNVSETALFRRCGFALVDLNGHQDEEPCYLAVRPVRNLEI